ncbi:hypothetical protein EV356DRAFT_504971 [Viridothelium virens]|uniref:Zn(2)-C6 fungal-type domain-containing protein n=1 Tax=Viridothelium virens TaxID=1048519 RepID=A0A6A6H491_VIRVR|nr:hypothetical protein EV356DRAFT_504971 [Viridothelium virens]
MLNPISVVLKSQNVCWSCRIRKQRCDKSLPSCSRCSSKLLQCSYAWSDSQPLPQTHRSSSPVTATPLLVRQCPNCPDLSPHGARELLQAGSMDGDPRHMAQLTTDILEALHITPTELLDDYCTSIHPWLPLLELEHFRSRLVSWPQSGVAELATLICALYLVTRQPCPANGRSMRSILYQTVRQMFMLRASGDGTLELLQAGLLIAYYACGHGLPRDAHMTLAICVALGRLLGLDFEGMNEPAELDKQHLVCQWATVLLDRGRWRYQV